MKPTYFTESTVQLLLLHRIHIPADPIHPALFISFQPSIHRAVVLFYLCIRRSRPWTRKCVGQAASICVIVNSMQNLMPTLSKTSAKRHITCPKYK
jgi:hypothetical protein